MFKKNSISLTECQSCFLRAQIIHKGVVVNFFLSTATIDSVSDSSNHGSSPVSQRPSGFPGLYVYYQQHKYWIWLQDLYVDEPGHGIPTSRIPLRASEAGPSRRWHRGSADGRWFRAGPACPGACETSQDWQPGEISASYRGRPGVTRRETDC